LPKKQQTAHHHGVISSKARTGNRFLERFWLFGLGCGKK